MARDNAGNFLINTIIGPNTNITGNIDAGGFIRIDGSLRGDLKANGKVIIGERARVKGDVTGKNITIGGVVYGNVIADGHLIILSTALIIGDIITRRIQADDGCFINGLVMVCPEEEFWIKKISEYRDEQGIKSSLPVFNKT